MVDRAQEIIKALRAVPPTLSALTTGLTAEEARRRPAPGEWSVAEVAGHLADVEEHAVDRVRRMLAEDTPVLASFDHEQLVADADHQHTPVADSLARHAALRTEHVALLEQTDEAGWDRTAQHDVHGTMTVFDYLLHVVCEEVDHLAQTAELR